MFNFIFDGSIGQMLAPVTDPNHQLYLAIQHNKNDEVRRLLLSPELNASAISGSGYAAIHVACRYNNRDIVEVLFSLGQLVDVVFSLLLQEGDLLDFLV